MATNFPASLDTLTNPTSSDSLNSPSHSAQHANSNDAIEALQAKVGVDGSAVTTSHDYILTNGVLPTLNVDSGVLVVDDTNNRVGVNDASPSYALDVTGDINATSDLRIGGTAIGEWTSFTPTWTNLTIGNATQTFAYSVVNNIVFIEGRLAVTDGTTSISGLPFFTAPVVNVVASGETPIGQISWFDVSAFKVYSGFITHGGGNNLRIWVNGAGGTYVERLTPSSTVPFGLSSGDQLTLRVTYRES